MTAAILASGAPAQAANPGGGQDDRAAVGQRVQPSTKPPGKAESSSIGLILGGVDINGYCRSIGYSGAQLYEYNAFGWRCYNSNGGSAGMNLNSACAWNYPWAFIFGNYIYAAYTNFNDPYSWGCYVIPRG